MSSEWERMWNSFILQPTHFWIKMKILWPWEKVVFFGKVFLLHKDVILSY